MGKLTNSDIDLYLYVRKGRLISERGVFPMTFQLWSYIDDCWKTKEVTLDQYIQAFSYLKCLPKKTRHKGKGELE